MENREVVLYPTDLTELTGSSGNIAHRINVVRQNAVEGREENLIGKLDVCLYNFHNTGITPSLQCL